MLCRITATPCEVAEEQSRGVLLLGQNRRVVISPESAEKQASEELHLLAKAPGGYVGESTSDPLFGAVKIRIRLPQIANYTIKP